MFWTIVRFCLRLPVATTLAYGLQSMFPGIPLLCAAAGVAGFCFSLMWPQNPPQTLNPLQFRSQMEPAMSHYVEIKILAEIPEHDRHAGHKAIVVSEESVADVVKALEGAGVTSVVATREIVRRTGARKVAAASTTEA